MKMMRKIWILGLLLLLLPVLPAAAAEDLGITVTASPETVTAGEEFTLTVALENNPGSIRGVQVDISGIDGEKVECLAQESLLPKTTEVLFNEASYQSEEKTARLLYVDEDGTLPATTKDIFQATLKAGESLTGKGKLTLPVKVMVQTETEILLETTGNVYYETVAKITDQDGTVKYYRSLAEALAEAKKLGADTITLLANSNETVEIDFAVTIVKGQHSATNLKGINGYRVNETDDAYIVEKIVVTLAHTGTNLRLQDLIKIGYYFNVTSEETIESVGALLWTAEQYAAETDFTVNSALAKHYENVEKNGSAYIIETDGIRAQNLDDTFVMIPYAKTASGYTYGPAKEYNALVYCEWAYKNGNSNLKSLIVDLLNYATLAREYFCITENLPAMVNGFNSLLREADRVVDWNESLKVSYPTVNEPGTFDAKYAGRNVNLKDALSIGLYFTNMTVAGGYVWNEADYKANTEHTAENRTTVTVDERASNNVKLNVVGLFAYNIYDNYYVRAYNANGDLGATVGTSIAGYLSYQVDNANTATAQGQALKALAQAMLVYGDNARSNPSINKK